MTTLAERYDRLASRYDRWWAPVLAPAARGVAAELIDLVAHRPAARILDIGTGTGTLAMELVRRFPNVIVTGVDASAGMTAEAHRLARRTLPADAAGRLDFIQADAAALPFQDETFDAAVSSFVFQLVPNRHAALRAAQRVLRPEGLLAVLTWLGDEAVFEPDEVFEDAIDALDLVFGSEPGDRRIGNFTSVGAAAAQVRRAGFGRVAAVAAELVHQYEPDRYLAFLESYAEHTLFEGLSRRDRDRLRDESSRRLASLQPKDFLWRMSVVTVTGHRTPVGPTAPRTRPAGA